MATLWFLFAMLCITTAEPLVEHTKELADLQSGNQEAHAVSCPDGWFNHGSRCFLYVNNPLGWNDAADHCQKIGAELASIHNPEENRFLQLLVQVGGQNDVWIGAYYLQTKWRWIDGNGMYYNDWIGMSSASSNPCAYLRKNNGWANSGCSTNRRFICGTASNKC